MSYNDTLKSHNTRLQAILDGIEAIPNTQEKVVEITENGTTEITADEGYLLSKVTANVNVGVVNKFIQVATGTLSSITAEDLQGVTSIADYAFNSKKSLRLLFLPEGLTTIGQYSFSSNTMLTEVHIPSSLTTIRPYAFQSSSAITKVYVTDIDKWNKVEFGVASNPASTTSGKANFYLNNTLITDLIIPENIIAIGNSVFTGYSFTSVTIPNSVTSIGSSSFQQCTKLANVTIGNSVTSISSNAFYGCAIEKFVIKAVNPPTIQSTTFKNVPTTCIYEVPAASVEVYKAATNWSALNIVASEEF